MKNFLRRYNMIILHCFPLLALLSLVVLISVQQAYAQEPLHPRVLPLDPLTLEEKQVAERVARADPRVQQLLGNGRQKLIEVEFLAIKPEDEALTQEDEDRLIQIGRHAAVVFYRYDGNLGARAIVDLEHRLVTQVESLDGDVVPASFEELAESRALALQNEELRELLGPKKHHVEGMRLLAVDESDPCWEHRCLDLLFRRGRFYRTDLPRVIVDLTAQIIRLEREELQ
jgi:Cu2+-containing amine oxidase